MPSFFASPFVRRLLTLSVCILSASLFACDFVRVAAEDFEQPEPLEPEVAEASAEAEEMMAGIRVPEGWTIRLFAAEPDVANVVAFDIDHRGRVFVCESFRQNRGVTDNRGHDQKWLLADLAAETVQDRIDYHKRLLGEAAITYAQHDDRIRRLEDTDGDGKADQTYLVANGFNHIEEGTGAGVLVRGSDIYYTNIPKLWKLIDKDDNGTADERVALSDGYGVRVAFRGHDMHGLVMGPDGRLYFSIGDRGYNVTTDDGRVLANPESGAVFRCELDGSGLEVFANGLRNPQELAFNDQGDLFSVDNNSDSGDMARIVHILEGGDTGWRMHYQYLPDRGPFNREKIWEPLHPEQPAYIVPPIANFTDGPSGLAFYPGTGFGDALKNTFLICDFRGGPANSGVRTFQLDPEGAFYRLGVDSDPIWSVLATDIAFGPDGGLYVSDWVDGWEGLGKGRIYRLTDSAHIDTPIVKEVQELLSSDWSARAVSNLSQDLSHVDRRVRFEAQWQLATRGIVEPLLEVALDATSDPNARLHSVWGIDQTARLMPEKREALLTAIRPLLSDADAVIRAAVAKSLGERGDKPASEALRGLLKDDNARVRYFAAMSLGDLKDPGAFPGVVGLLAGNANLDPALRHAGMLYLAKLGDDDRVGKLAAHDDASVRRAAVVALRRMRSDKIVPFLSDADPLVVAEAGRAIHDEPIPVAMNALAGLIDSGVKDPELLRRVLNANYRLGATEAAERIAQFAADHSADVDMRVEALEMLGAWTNPDPRDRVLGRFRPLDPRPAKPAADALSAQVETLMTADGVVREKAIEIASGLGLKKIIPMLVQRVGDAEKRPTLRANSLRALANLDPKQAAALARKVKMVPTTALLPASLEVLWRVDPKNSMDRFVTATQSRDVKVRQLAWDILAKLDDPKASAAIAAGVNDYLRGKLSDDVHLNVLEAANGRVDAKLSEKLAAHAESAKTDPLGPWLASLQGGDSAKGEKIFMEKTEVSCLRCHKVDRAGGEVGPNLTLIGKQRDRRYLLESICVPNAQIAKGFETAVIADDIGQSYTGIVKAENDEFIELIQADGSQKRVYLDEIVARRKGNSSMPADLAKFLSPRELRDLVAYLANLQVDPRGADATE